MDSYIDVLNPGRDTDAPFLTLWSDESIRLFFGLVCSSQEYLKFWKNGRIALVSFNHLQSQQTGTGYYSIEQGKVKTLSETGALQDLLQHVQFDRIV